MGFGQNLGRALGTVGQNLGTVANYQAEQQRFEEQQKILDRREQANMQFRAHLEELQMQNGNEQKGLDRAQQGDQFGQTMNLHRDEMAINQQRADTADKRADQQQANDSARLGLDRDRVGIEQQRADTQKAATGDSKTVTAIGSQMKNLGSTITANRRQMQQEIAGAYKSSDWMMKSDGEKQAILNGINAKYKPVIDSAQAKYDQYSKKWEDLTGVADAGSDYASSGSDLGGPTETPDTSTDSGEAAPVGGAGQAAAGGNANVNAPPAKYPNAKKAPDGQWYIPNPSIPGKWLRVNQ